MGFFDDISKKVSDVGQKTLQKTREVSDTVKLNSQISDEEKRINNTYCEIGKLYFQKHADDAEDAFMEMFQVVRDAEQKINEYREQIQNIKGVQRCPQCGAEVPRGNAYCSYCGAKIEQPQNAQPQNETILKCANCGNEIKPGMKFCTACGTPVGQQAADFGETATDTAENKPATEEQQEVQ